MSLKLLLFFSVCFALSSCGNNQDDNADPASTDEQCTDASDVSTDDPVIPDPTCSTDEDPKDYGPLSEEAYNALIAAGIFVEEGAIFTTTYHEGYNLNFEITEDQARSLLPPNLTPLPLKLIETDTEPRYYLSWYLAVLDPIQTSMSIARIDLFTYATNESGELALQFVASYMSVPESISSNESVFEVFKEMFDFFALDSRTGEPAYPHYYTDHLTADHDTFKFVFENSSIEATKCDPLTENERFSREFLMANSQIYRNEVDKNVNYFNQSFINAKVETRNLDCISFKNLSGFHPFLENLVSVQFYGSKDKDIVWYYEMCTGNDCSSPFGKN